MNYLVYIGSCNRYCTNEDLKLIIPVINAWMHRNKISGLLLKVDSSMVYYMEGSPKDLEEAFLFMNMHFSTTDPIRLLEGELEQMYFNDWKMAINTDSPKEMEHVVGYKDISNAKAFISELSEKEHPALDLVTSIYQNTSTKRLRFTA